MVCRLRQPLFDVMRPGSFSLPGGGDTARAVPERATMPTSTVLCKAPTPPSGRLGRFDEAASARLLGVGVGPRASGSDRPARLASRARAARSPSRRSRTATCRRRCVACASARRAARSCSSAASTARRARRPTSSSRSRSPPSRCCSGGRSTTTPRASSRLFGHMTSWVAGRFGGTRAPLGSPGRGTHASVPGRCGGLSEPQAAPSMLERARSIPWVYGVAADLKWTGPGGVCPHRAAPSPVQ